MFITVRRNTVLKILAALIFAAAALFYIVLTPGGADEDAPPPEPSQPPSSLSPSAVSGDLLCSGALLLVNKDHLLPRIPEEGLVYLSEEKADSFRLRDNTLQLREDCVESLNRFLTDAADQGHISSLVVLSAYRTFSYQQKLYDAELAEKGEEGKKWVAPPGGSEHHTGYAFDLAVADRGKLIKITDGEMFRWLREQCAAYGFVLRYPEGKEEQTGFSHEPWHFRYVGLPHSVYMAENGLCLEEYIGLLENTDGEHPLQITTGDGNYQVYRMDAAEGDQVQIPEGAVVSGDNCGGLIITVRR